MNKLNRSQKSPANRLDDRLASRLPIKVGKAEGVTHNISASGVFFEIEKKQSEGSKIKFTIELNTPGGAFNLKCQANVVRVQELNGRYGIGAHIISQEFVSIQDNTN